MKFRKKVPFFFPVLTVWMGMISAGCAGIPEKETAPPPHAAVAIQPEENGRELLEAFLKQNAKAFVGALPEDLRKQFGKKEFEGAYKSITETLGKPVSYQFATQLENPLLTVSVWKIRFEHRNKENKLVRQEALFRVISGIIDGHPRIISFNFL